MDTVFMDWTSLFFEAPQQGIVRVGYSRGRRPDRPQVTIGLSMGREGHGGRCINAYKGVQHLQKGPLEDHRDHGQRGGYRPIRCEMTVSDPFPSETGVFDQDFETVTGILENSCRTQ